MTQDRTYSLRAYPLAWPEGWKRTAHNNRVRGNFGRSVQKPGFSWKSKESLTVSQALQRVLIELRRMGISENDVVVSTNLKLRLDGLPRSDQGNPADPGAAVYWRKSNKSPMKCMAIDGYERVENNLAAIAATLDAMRAIERHGGAEILERTFQGFSALPAQASSTWRSSLEFDDADRPSLADVNARFKQLALKHHPDVGGDPERFREITEARAAARTELGAA